MLQFESPWSFAALGVLVPLVLFWHWRSYADLSVGRRRLTTGLRLLGLVLVVMALAKPVWMLPNEDRAVLFLIDASESVEPASLEAAWAEIDAALLARSDGEHAGVVLFGERPVLAVAPTAEPLEMTPELRRKLFHQAEKERIAGRIQELERTDLNSETEAELGELTKHQAEIEAFREEIGVEGTNIEAACRLARGVMPLEVRRRVMLYSDGNANRGDVLREVAELERAGFSAHTAILPKGDDPEVVAVDLLLPAQAQVRAPFAVEVAVHASQATSGTLEIYRNKYRVGTKEVELKQGRNLLQLDRVTLDEGFHEFEAIIAAKDDTQLENNIARGIVRVSGKPKVLLVEGEEREARYLAEALDGEGIDVEIRPESGVPADLNDLLNYEALILSDIPAERFAPGAMEAVKTYVREMGGGFVMLGGEHSFGLGGYYRTPIEDALPVKMPIKKNVEKPNLALVLVIDKSGSMGGHKMELAKEAAIASSEVLKGNDRFGVVAFDGRAEWISPIGDSTDVGTITGNIARLVAGGGTNIYPALYEAYQALLDEDAKIKHIILLSDGQTQGSGYDTLVGHIAAEAITLSTVGIGEGADQQLLGDMASWGGGESYFTNDFASIPQIFTRETMRASKAMLVEEPFVPTQTADHEILKGIVADDLPFLLGYVATQPKERATVTLASDYADPVLASWNYGLGRSVAFTSDAKARWAGDWIGWEGYPKFWGQLVRSVMSTGAHRELRPRTRVEIEQGQARVTIDVRDRLGAYRDDVTPEVSILGAEGSEDPLAIEHLAPGLFRASFPIEEYGEFYRLLTVLQQDGVPVDIQTLGVTESYSPEFRTPVPDTELMRQVADRTGGVYQPDQEALWAFDGEPARTPKDTWWWWLLAAACLLPLDIALRRLGA